MRFQQEQAGQIAACYDDRPVVSFSYNYGPQRLSLESDLRNIISTSRPGRVINPIMRQSGENMHVTLQMLPPLQQNACCFADASTPCNWTPVVEHNYAPPPTIEIFTFHCFVRSRFDQCHWNLKSVQGMLHPMPVGFILSSPLVSTVGIGKGYYGLVYRERCISTLTSHLCNWRCRQFTE